ncbi:hypothetical protein [Limnoglobus roseus]|uniref:Uncharacterized protein n=1 Tax=Limnoglobus roseus TaxID=2598579 RepID=A0A5C1AJY6_9BACT|nr:hypothetical protein [Limnoglobus roseus]QEL18513.1 hypothetical protein PX52LOC_05539 [Limnoglobus roseus]
MLIEDVLKFKIAESDRLSEFMPRGTPVRWWPFGQPDSEVPVLAEIASRFGLEPGSPVVRVRLRGAIGLIEASRLLPLVEQPHEASKRRDEFIRAGGDVTCPRCGRFNYDHPTDQFDSCLTILCDLSRVKL